MKKFMSFLLCAVLLCICCPLAGASVMDEPDAEEYIEYPLAGGHVFFHPGKGQVAWASGLKGDVVVPAEFDGVAVKRLTQFAGNEEMTSVTLPEGLETVEINSFVECTKLQTIRLSSTVREMPCGGLDVGNAAYRVAEGNLWFSADSQGVLYNKEKTVLVRCPKTVTEYDVPEGVEELGEHCFSDCRGLTSVALPESLQTIRRAAFESCSALRDLYIPAGVSEIEEGMGWLGAAFRVDPDNTAYCSDDQGALYDKAMKTLLRFPSSHERAVLPQSVTAIGRSAFTGSKVKSVSLPAALETIGEYAFNSCSNLTEIKLPEGLRSIGDRAFSNCAVRRVELPDSLELLGLGAFSGAYGLEAMIFPEDIAEVADTNLWEYGLCYVEKGSPMEQKLIDRLARYRYGRPEDYSAGLPGPMAGTTYIDLDPEEWGLVDEDILQAHAEGWMRGESSLYFQPEKAATRAMFVTTLYRMAGSPEPAEAEPFPDVKPGCYYEKAALWAKERAVLMGDKGRMRPDRAVTNEEAAAMVYRYLLSEGLEIGSTERSNFGDRASIAPWALEAVDALSAVGVFDDGEYSPETSSDFWWEAPYEFSPRSGVSRRELAALLCRIENVRETWNVELPAWNGE